MSSWWTRFRCNHIWEDIAGGKKLGRIISLQSNINDPSELGRQYDRFTVPEKCILCDAARITESRSLKKIIRAKENGTVE